MSAFDVIKKQNGEAFAKAVRAYDNGIFDVPDIASMVRYAGREAEPIMNFLLSLKNIRIAECGKTAPFEELLDKAGYHVCYADTLEKQNAIEKYFAEGEKLCTFADNERYQKYHIINVVRKDVDKIRREDFPFPRREDAYGTSVMSIQILKTGGFISIKNRYNHRVVNPDNTYFSNPDNIIEGLSASLKERFGVDFASRRVAVPDGYVLLDEGLFKCHREIENVHFGNGFFIEDGDITFINKDYQILCDTLLLDLKKGKFETEFNEIKGAADILNREIEGKKLSVRAKKGVRSVYADDKLFMEVKDDCSKITFLNLPTTEHFPKCVFDYVSLGTLNVPNLKTIEDCCFGGGLEEIYAPKGVVVQGSLSVARQGLKKLPNFSDFIVKESFFCYGNKLTSLEGAPQTVGNDFICYDNKLTSLRGAPEKISGRFYCHRNELTSLEGAPQFIGRRFDCQLNQLATLEGAPQFVGDDFDCSYNALATLKGGPKRVEGSFYCSKNELVSLEGAPAFVGEHFVCNRNNLTSLNGAPKFVGASFSCEENRLPENVRRPRGFKGDFFSINQKQKESAKEKPVLSVRARDNRRRIILHGKTHTRE